MIKKGRDQTPEEEAEDDKRLLEMTAEPGFHEKVTNDIHDERIELESRTAREKVRIKNHSNDDFLLDESKSIQSVDHALGTIKDSIGNSFRYFGVWIEQKVVHETKKGESREEIKLLPALVLEDRRLISGPHPQGFHFKFNTIMTTSRNRWSLQGIKDFTEIPEDVSFTNVFEKFKDMYDHFMVYDDPLWYDLEPIWDMCTYFHDIIDKSLIIKREGPSGSAKSKGMKTSANQSFNGRLWVRPTAANFFRYRHFNKSTIYLEEAERLFANDKKKNSEDDEIVEYINASYEKGRFVPRQDDKDRNLTLEFDPFGFTQIGSINPIEGATLKRSITHYMIISKKSDSRGNLEVPGETASSFQKNRDWMYACSLLHYKEFEITLSTIKNTWSFANREWQLVKPILAMADCIDNTKALKEKLAVFLERRFDVRDDAVNEDDWETIISGILLRMTCKSSQPIFILNEQLRSAFLEHEKIGNYANVSSRYLTRLLKRIGFGDHAGKQDSSGSARGVRNLSFARVCDILKRNNNWSVEDIIKKVSDVSECQFSIDKIKEIYSDTSLTEKESVSIISDNLTDTTHYSDPPHKKNQGSSSGSFTAAEGS